MLVDVIEAIYQEAYKIQIAFEDGICGIVDFSDYPTKGGVFSRFEDMNFFKNFAVNPELGTIVWGELIDIAPETLYEKCLMAR
jgi:hypothetical protein